ncbi:hypothetical protein M9458_012634, partial [Cirrhinus mrigala]
RKEIEVKEERGENEGRERGANEETGAPGVPALREKANDSSLETFIYSSIPPSFQREDRTCISLSLLLC